MRIAVEHRTSYRYEAPATYSAQLLRLTPAAFDGQKVIDWKVDSQPAMPLREGRDGFGNITHFLTVNRPHEGIEIVASGTVETADAAGVVAGLPETVPLAVYLRHTPLTEPNAVISALVVALPASERVPWLHALMAAIRERVAYVTGVTGTETTAAQALAAGQGVCQDHAHIFIAAARQAGVPARYVTGYLFLDDPDRAVAHHAWAEAWVAGLGWVGFDAANGVCPTEHYVRLAAALDARYAAPIRGMHRGGVGESLAVEVKVQQAVHQQ